MARYLKGDFDAQEAKAYAAAKAVVFWSIIFVCWLLYPEENKHSIWTHTFSFLGSFEAKHNPQWWWLFSVAMVFWGTATLPLVLFFQYRFRPAAPWGAKAGALLFAAGCLGIILVGVFPDAPGRLIGEWRWTDIHEKAAILVVVGFGLGVPWFGILLLKDRFAPRRSEPHRLFHYSRFIPPYLFYTVLMGLAIFFQVRWEILYADMKAQARAAGETIGSSWSEGLNTWYSFPFWENIVVATIYLFLLWFTFAAAGEPGKGP